MACFKESRCYIVCVSNSVFREYERVIRKRLTTICAGFKNSKLVSVAEVAGELLERIGDPTSDRAVGFIGELLYYVFADLEFTFLKPINPMLNSEERSFKKGFDALSACDHEIWYSEVKSGKIRNESSATDVILEKLKSAYSDINTKLASVGGIKNKNYWITAKMKLACCVEGNDEISRLSAILDDDANKSIVNNKIIVSVAFGGSSCPVSEEKINEVVSKLRSNDKDLVVVCIHEELLQRTIDLLKEMASEDSI